MILANLNEWANLCLRWMHVIAAISWIGSSFYFMWLDRHLAKPLTTDENVAGALWMVHSGGFYRVEKRYLAAGQVPGTLHWFKYEALLTWVTGISLLTLVYYTGGIMTDAGLSPIGEGTAVATSLALIVAAWAIYDTLWVSPLGQKVGLASAISFLLLVAEAFGLSATHLFSGRAMYLHIGATLGTLMVANVWMRILPAQREMIAATQAGKPRDLTLAHRAKMRSVHNNYMTFPVIVIMVSNHFPSTYGNEWNWLLLAGLILVGAAVRHFMNVPSRATLWLLLAAGIGIGALSCLTL